MSEKSFALIAYLGLLSPNSLHYKTLAAQLTSMGEPGIKISSPASVSDAFFYQNGNTKLRGWDAQSACLKFNRTPLIRRRDRENDTPLSREGKKTDISSLEVAQNNFLSEKENT